MRTRCATRSSAGSPRWRRRPPALGAAPAAEAIYTRGSPALVNQQAPVDAALAAATAVVGHDRVDGALRPTTGGEDFAEFARLRPAAYMWIGNGRADDGAFHAPHTPGYDFNDAIIPDGVRYWVNLVRRELGDGG